MKKTRPRTAKRAMLRKLGKRIAKVQQEVNTGAGLRVVEDYMGQEMTPPLLAAMAGRCRYYLAKQGVDMEGLDVYPASVGSQLQLRVGPRAPVLVGREGITGKIEPAEGAKVGSEHIPPAGSTIL